MANLATINNNILADSGIDPLSLIVGTGTVNYVSKFTAEDTVANSQIFDNGTNVGIGTATPLVKLHVINTAGVAAYFTSSNNSVPVSLFNNGSALATIGFKGTTTSSEFNVRVGADANDFVAYTNNTERMRITSGGNLLVGTTSDGGQKLTVNGDISVATLGSSIYFDTTIIRTIRQYVSGSFDFNIENQRGNTSKIVLSSSTITLGSMSTVAMTVDTSSGNVGIGTTSPTSKLQSNNASTYNSSTPSGAIIASNLSNGNGIIDIGVDATYLGYIQSRNITNTTFYNLLLNPLGGNVGIGTTSPQAKLDVIGVGVFGTMTSSRSTYSNGLSLQNNTGEATSLFLWQSGVASAHIGSPANSTSLHIVNSYNTGLITDPNSIVLTSTGKVGIGTTSPAYKLEVSLPTTTSDIVQRWTSPSYDSVDLYIGSSQAYFGTLSTTPLAFRTANTERMRITSAGLVGIGTSNPANILSIKNGAAQLDINTTTSTVTLEAIDRGNTGNSVDIGYYARNGSHIFYNGAYAERMRVTSGGQVGINTSSPEQLFTVAGGSISVSGNTGLPRQILELTTASTVSIVRASYQGMGSFGDLALWTGGSERMRIATNGAVRFNAYGSGSFTGTVAYNLAVDASGNIIETAGGVVDGSGTANYVPLWSDPNTLTNSTIYQTGGDVGIGTTSPQTKLHVSGDITLGTTLLFSGTNLYPRLSRSTNDLYFSTNGAGEVMRIIDAGRVGIGTSSPSYTLDISTAQSIRVLGSSTGYTQGSIIFQSSTTDTPQARGLGVYAFNEGTDATWFYGTGYNAADTFVINRKSGVSYQASAAAPGESSNFFAITNGGNIGIGTTTPGYKLDVNGVIRSTISGVGTLNLGTDTYTYTNTAGQVIATSSPSYTSSGKLSFKVLTWGVGSDYGPTEQMYIDVTAPDTKAATLVMLPWGGNVGIGTTSPTSILDASLSGGATSGFRFKGWSDSATPYLLSLGTQTYQDIFQIKSVNGLVTMGIVGAVGATPDLAFQTNSTERMRITSGGNVLIGTTTDVSGVGKFVINYASSDNYGIILNNTYTATSNNGYFQRFYNNGTEIGTFYAGNAAGSLFSIVGKDGLSFATNGAPIGTERMRIATTGAVRFNAYGSGSFTGTVAYNLAVDASGNIIETAGGVVDGSGTANYVPKWSDPNTLTNSMITDDGTTVTVNGVSTVYFKVKASTNSGIDLLQDTAGTGYLWNRDNAAIQFGTNNTERMRLNSNGTLSIGNTNTTFLLDIGSSSTFPFRAISSSGAGFQINGSYAYTDAYNHIFRSLNGSTTYATIDNNGNLGLGITPSATAGGKSINIGAQGYAFSDGVSYQYNSGFANNAYVNGNGTYAAIVSRAAGILEINESSFIWKQASSGTAGSTLSLTSAMTLDASGRLGIGTTSPAAKLDIGGATVGAVQAIFGRGNDDNNFTVRYTNGTSGTNNAVQGTIGLDYANGVWADMAAIKFIRNSTAGELSFFTSSAAASGTEKVRITSAGNVGIGTSSPAGKLEIVGSSGGLSLKLPSGEWYGASSTNRMAFDNPNQLFHTGGSGGAYKFRNAADGADVMTITNTGNVGIGTTSPATLLDVRGNAQVKPSTGTDAVWNRASNDSGEFYLGIDNSAGSGFTGTAYARFLYATGGYPITLHTNGNERMRINSGGDIWFKGASSSTGYEAAFENSNSLFSIYGSRYGGTGKAITLWATGSSESMRINYTNNVLIGTTTDAGYKLNVNGNAKLGSGTSSLALKITGDDNYIEFDNSGTYIKGGGNLTVSATSNLLLFTGASERVRITSGGNVGIGTSNPNANLDVYTSQGGTAIAATHGVGGSYPKASGISFGATSTSLTVSNNGGTVTFTGGAGIYANNTASSNNPTDLVFWTTQFGSPAERMRIVTGGNVGIGTSSPSYKLQVAGGDIAIDYGRYLRGGSGGDWNLINLYNGGTGDMEITMLNTNWYLRHNANATFAGNVGIGTSSPSYKLDVVGTTARVRDAGNVNYVSLSIYGGVYLGGNGTGGVRYAGTETNDNFALVANNSEKVRITTGGYVGIGTSNPTCTLDVRTDSGVLVKGATSDIDGRIALVPASGGRQYGLRNYGSSFGIKDESADVIRMYFHYDGNTGIGTTSPSYKLDVVGNIASNAGTNEAQVFVKNSTSSIYLFNSYAGNSFGIFDGTAGQHRLLYDRASNFWAFYTGASERMRITSGGNLLVGTTSDAGYKLDVTGTLRVNGNNNTAVALTVNGSDASEGLVAKFARGASEKNFYISATNNQYVNLATEGNFRFKTGISVNQPYTSGNDPMVLTSTGNVGIGTSSPTVKLQVSGTTLFEGGYANFLASGTIALRIGADGSNDIFMPSGRNLSISAEDNILFRTSGALTERFRITSSGNVGIGTSSPSGQLEVYEGFYKRLFVSYPNSTTTRLSIGHNFYIDNDQSPEITSFTNSSGTSIFRWLQGSTPTERMRLSPSGNLLIGTTSDAGQKLQVNGNGYFNGNLETTVDLVLSRTDVAPAIVTVNGNLRLYKSSGAGAQYSLSYDNDTITFSGSIKTAAPSGGTAATWKLGSRISNTCGLPLAYSDFVSQFMNTNKVIEVEIGGVTVYIPTVTPGWC